KIKQQELLSARLCLADVIVTTAAIPGRKAPVLIPEETVKKMKPGSVIIDMAASSGGNCPLTQAGQVTQKYGVTLVGHINYPSMVPADSSFFYGNNLMNLLALLTGPSGELKVDLTDEIIAASLLVYKGEIRHGGK